MIMKQVIRRLKTSKIAVVMLLLAGGISTANATSALTLTFPFTRDSLCNLSAEPDHPRDVSKLHSLCSVWYPGNPIIPLTTLTSLNNTPWHNACSVLYGRQFGTTDDDIALFDRAFGKTETQSPRRNALCFYSLVDRDNDGLRDFRIASTGQFIENDNDVDNDGVVNVLDANPFAAGDSIPDALPERLRFRCDLNQALCNIQSRMYDDFGVTLVNRDFDESNPSFVSSVISTADTIELVFGEGIKRHPNYDARFNRLPSLQTVYFQFCDTLERSPWDSDRNCSASLYETEASAATHNQSFTVYNHSAIKPDFVRLGIFAHELAHSWSFAYDHHTADGRSHILRENLWAVPEFEKELEAFGWEITQRRASEILNDLADSGLLVSADTEVLEHDPRRYALDGLPLEVLVDLASAVDLNERVARKYGLIGTYALSSPWEWQADAVLAYVFRKLERQILKRASDRSTAGDLRKLFRAHTFEQWHGLFYHANLKSRVFDRIDRQLALSDTALDRLVCRYVIHNQHDFFAHPDPDGVASGMTDGIDVALVKTAVQNDWRSICGI